jgi:hypothetical protein
VGSGIGSMKVIWWTGLLNRGIMNPSLFARSVPNARTLLRGEWACSRTSSMPAVKSCSARELISTILHVVSPHIQHSEIIDIYTPALALFGAIDSVSDSIMNSRLDEFPVDHESPIEPHSEKICSTSCKVVDSF